MAISFGALCCLVNPTSSPANVEYERDTSDPKPRVCDDPIVGVWVGQQIYMGDFYRLTMEIQRKTKPEGGKELEGLITSHYWSGQSTPPPTCEPGGYETIIDMKSAGFIDDDGLLFAGVDWSRRQHICGPTGSYVPDGFIGKFVEVDGQPQINAQWYAVYEPVRDRDELLISERNVRVADVRFHRVRCTTDPIVVDEVPNTPAPKSESLCGCF